MTDHSAGDPGEGAHPHVAVGLKQGHEATPASVHVQDITQRVACWKRTLYTGVIPSTKGNLTSSLMPRLAAHSARELPVMTSAPRGEGVNENACKVGELKRGSKNL